ncbi:hypothetical protein [Mycobacterium sp.]|uniref:hypothetical protein n=1 Tax=Mycobacterium sp. TaxID=1785 RepID=UPI002CFF404F|nr:hypothetical protein [Mycobacterium sp.]HME50458.1 hypothetical protein [Mycobacterium sp.]
MAFRTDFAGVEAGWVTGVALKLQVDGSALASVGHTLVQYTETRFCVATIGSGAASLFVTMQLHKLSPASRDSSAAIRIPRRGSLRYPVVLRSVKSWGRLLGPDGRAREVLPVDLWAPAG